MYDIKITDIKMTICGNPPREGLADSTRQIGEIGYIICDVSTDAGIHGIGMTYCESGNEAIVDFAEKTILPVIQGMNPFDTECIWEKATQYFRAVGRKGLAYLALSAVDIACWDIKGKKFGVPVYQLLGGKTNDNLRTYASQIQFGWGVGNAGEIAGSVNLPGIMRTPEDYYNAAKSCIEAGFDAVKVDPVFNPMEGLSMATQGCHFRGAFPHADLRLATERVAAIREAGGEDLDIIIELHSLLDTNTAIELGQSIQKYRIMYMEEPTQPLNPSLYKTIQSKIDIPLATGERSYTRWGFRQFFEDRTLSIAQPDLCNTGGFTECKKICDMAHTYDIGIQIHVCGGPIATAAALQLEAVIPNFVIHEHHVGAIQPICTQTCLYDYEPVNGRFKVPELPGIGQELTKEEMEKCRKVTVE